ncbi:hypothetical protein GUF79_00010 [Xanthomonas citri pv. citri]|nr:hypothetical protein [Xanthomonas citri pv. citri]
MLVLFDVGVEFEYCLLGGVIVLMLAFVLGLFDIVVCLFIVGVNVYVGDV